jgi:hypothetical protein
MGKAKPQLPEKELKLYDQLVALFPEIERKGASMPYTSMNGHMFSFLKPDGEMAIRLPDDQLQAFIKSYETKQTIQHGRVMKEYADVPESLLRRTGELKKHFGASIQYVQTLKPKATKRKRT